MWSVGNGGWEGCVIVFFTHSLVNYENNNKPSSLLEPEKETVSNETMMVCFRQVFIDLL